jgi:DNA-binding GntR family transcriptional regulator
MVEGEPIRALPLREHVYERLQQMLVTRVLAPGDHLVEERLAGQLGVSRGPVREALRQLEQEGLVEFFPHRGAVVVGVAEAEVETIYGIRALLEGRAFAQACRVVTDADLDALAETVESMIAASEAGDVAAVTEYDLLFHGRVVEISGFQYLRRLWSSIDGVVRSRTANSAARPELANPAGAREWLIGPSIEHRELVDALRNRRPALASRAATAHVTKGLERLRADERR